MPAGGGERRRAAHLPRAAAATPVQHPHPGGAQPAASLRGRGADAAATTANAEVDQQASLRQLALELAQQGGPGGWGTLPHSALEAVFNHLELRDLAAAGSACSTWRYEASLDARWRALWQQQVSDGGLWRWAKADGGYRQQLRARQLVRRGDCAATVFPFNRRDGPVSEVLFFDGGPQDGHKRILTVQAPKVPAHSVRLQGNVLKVWDAAALMAQRPLLVVHDVLKHMQLEDGRLFLWHIADDAVVLTGCSDPDDQASLAEAQRWAEHPAIVSSVLEPGPLLLKDVPLQATYGRGVTPCEWLDMAGGLVAGSLMVPSHDRLIMRLFHLATGRCLRASACTLPEQGQAAQLVLQDSDMTMMVTRGGDAGCLVAATCCLFDTRIFLWRLKDEWVAAAAAAAAAVAAGEADAGEAGISGGGSSSNRRGRRQQQQGLEAACAAAWDPAATLAAIAAAGGEGGSGAPAAGAAAAGARPSGSQQQQQEEQQQELRHVYSTPGQEPVVDISIGTTAQRLYIVGMENIFIADLSSGVPYMRVSTLVWRGITPPGQDPGPADVGAYSWPLPNSTKNAFFLDATDSLFIAEFRRPQMSDFWYMQRAQQGEPAGRYPHFDHHIGFQLQGGPGLTYFVQSHTDLRPTPRANLLSTVSGRASGPRALEPGIVEYTQDGGVLLTTTESSCPAVAALLQLEKAGGSYLEGLGPGSLKPGRSGGGGATRGPRGQRQPVISRGGRAQRRQLAPRALVLIDSSSGCRFKAVPLEGACESVHSAGQYVVMSVAELSSFPDGSNGSIVVLDFSGQGFAAPTDLPAAAATTLAAAPEPDAAAAAAAAAVAASRPPGRRRAGASGSKAAGKQQVGGKAAGKGGSGKQEQKQRQGGHADAKPAKGGKSKKAAAATAAAASDDDAGPSLKRGRR